jgi:coronin-1B/1C/6
VYTDKFQVHENEVMRAYKTVNDSYIEPISFTVPRRAEVFQADIYPPATGLKPAVSAKDWLSGKDGVPSKIDLESVYDGSAPVEVPSDYKPPKAVAPTPAPTKAPEPKKEVEPAPTVRSPPPTISEQKGSIAAMASKFQDDEGADEEDDDASSFEEVSRPNQRSAVPVAAKVEKLPSPIKTTPTVTQPPKPSPGSTAQPTIRAAQLSPSIEKPSATSSSTDNSVESSLLQIKQLLEAQTRTITEQSQKIGQLAQEVDTLKRKVGSGSGEDQSERIRQLELELEAARS